MNEQQQAAYEIAKERILGAREGVATLTRPDYIVFLKHKKGEIFTLIVSLERIDPQSLVWQVRVALSRQGDSVPTKDWDEGTLASAKMRALFELSGVGEGDFYCFNVVENSIRLQKYMTNEELLGLVPK